MRRWVWWAAAGLTAGCGLVALAVWSLSAVIGWWVAGGLAVMALEVCQTPDEELICWAPVIRRSLLWPTMGLAVPGLFMTLEPAVALLVCTAGLVAAAEAGWFGVRVRGELPVVVHRQRGGRWRTRDVVGASPEASLRAVSAVVIPLPIVDPVEAALVVSDELTDSDLCMAWRSSYVALDRAVGLSQKLRAVEVREVILDELGHRDAPGLEAWFRSGARAAGWPDRYLRGAPPRQRRGVL